MKTIRLLTLLSIIFTFVLFSCEKSELEKPINQETTFLKSTLSGYLDSIQGNYYGYYSPGSGGAGQLEWNPQTQQLDTIRQYYKISNDTLTWIHWNESQDALWSSYFVPCEGIDCHYIITDIEVYQTWYAGWYATFTYSVDSAGIILKTETDYLEIYRHYSPYDDTTVIKTGISNMYPFGLRTDTPFDLYDTIQPDVIFGPTETFEPVESTNNYVRLSWIVGDEEIDGWLLYIEKDGELIVNGLIVNKDNYVDAYKKYYDYYYTETGNYKYYVKSFSSFGVSEISNETSFNILKTFNE